MELRLVVAIIRPLALEPVEKTLQEMGVRGLTVTRSKGFGAHANLFSRDWLVGQGKVEIYVEQDRVDSIVAAILDTAHSETPVSGIVAVLPVEKVFSVRTRCEAAPNRVGN